METNPARRVCFDQMKAIVDFMGQNTEFAMGVLRTTEARHKSKQLWDELAKIVNNIRGGTKKTPDMWSRYWSDFKNKLKKKVKILNRYKRLGTTDKGTKPLTKLEKRALVILGPKFVKVSSKRQSDYRNNLPAEVKVEAYLENNDFCKDTSDCSDRLSDGDQDGGVSDESSVEENGVIEPEFNEPNQNLYPKWLIQVEKKRAEAEYMRAVAEKQRVKIEAKHAEARLIQAEALQKLSEAASVQAEAMLRIARCLEGRGDERNILSPL